MLPLSPRLIVEPDDGLEPVREFIDSAQTSLIVKQFTFTEPSLVAAVIDRKKAGVDVRVQLNAARSGGDRANDETYEQFQSAGVASLMYVVTLFWQKAQKSKWRIAVEKGFAPLTVGLIMATSLVMSRAADHDWRAYLLTALCTVIFIRTKANPLIVVFAAGVLGYFGIV
ncbi:MAG TPA: chromate transporter [Mycobacterium sp.]|nr:chromate transporter [Mycobacterium sp.]